MIGHFLGLSVLAIFAAHSAVAAPTEGGLIAHYPLNEDHGGTVNDVSGNHRAAFGEFIEVVDGLDGKVYSFDGKKSVISLPEESVFEVTGDYSVSFWMRVEAGSEDIGLIYAQPDFAIKSFKGSLRVTFHNPKFGKTGYGDLMGPRVNDGEWHHVVVSHSGSSGETALYLDSHEATKGVFAHKPAVSTPTKVGGFGRTFYRGELGDLRIYSRFLDAVDVQNLRDEKKLP